MTQLRRQHTSILGVNTCPAFANNRHRDAIMPALLHPPDIHDALVALHELSAKQTHAAAQKLVHGLVIDAVMTSYDVIMHGGQPHSLLLLLVS
jgi:hypothetical protein